jgi:ATP-dependent helicase/DNAse subunit B
LLREAGSLIGVQMAAFPDFLDMIVEHNDPQAGSLTDLQRRLLVDDLIADQQARGGAHASASLLETRGFGDGLSHLFEELRRAGISPDAFTAAIKASEAKAEQCAALYAAYERELIRRHLLDREGRPWRACDILGRGPCRPFSAVRSLFLDGFTDFTPAQLSVLKSLTRSLDEVWISLPDESGDERAELFSRPRQTLGRLNDIANVTMEASDRSSRENLPAGLLHLERQLFRPLRLVEVAVDAAGIATIEAPGVFGEVQMVARRIKTLLLEGTDPAQIVVAIRDLRAYARVVREVFDEYAIPADIEGTEPLTRNPAVAVLLRAMRLPDDDWSFAGVTALLRHTYFRPTWPEAAEDRPQKAEALLRLLRKPRGREAYLQEVDQWALKEQPGLEDEDAEQARRRRTHDLARQCAPFLHRFFKAWDTVPERALPADHALWLRQLSTDLGITDRAKVRTRDRMALAILLDELENWKDEQPKSVDRKSFLRRVADVAASAGLPRSERGSGRVRVLSATQARHLSVDHLFITGLGERGFPLLTPPPSLLDESERQALVPLGLPATGASDLLPDEMLLFYQVATRARRNLVLSYPAVDERGHPLLPGSFLSSALACFTPGAVPVEKRSMLMEGLDRDIPLSAAEYRVRVAAASQGRPDIGRLPGDLGANLCDAADLYRQRFRVRENNPYDGRLRDAAVVSQSARIFGPKHIFSPTALEDYVACPFKFFMRHTLKLEPLEDPREEIEVTRRGQAFHRALARLHRRLKEESIHLPCDEVVTRAQEEMSSAIAEDMTRASGPAARELWRLEGQRLLRLAARYGEQWKRFVEPWLEKGIAPRPHHFEIDFGLPSPAEGESFGPLVVRKEGQEVSISGRIDRVDVVELSDGSAGFWIIDYKTGNAANYTSTDIKSYRKLQLTLYALAVEEVLLAGRRARPLGLAYWLVAEHGPKLALPNRITLHWLTETSDWLTVRETLRNWIADLVYQIRSGNFSLQPRSEHCTDTCEFGQICRISQARAVCKPGLLELPGVGSANRGSEE